VVSSEGRTRSNPSSPAVVPAADEPFRGITPKDAEDLIAAFALLTKAERLWSSRAMKYPLNWTQPITSHGARVAPPTSLGLRL